MKTLDSLLCRIFNLAISTAKKSSSPDKHMAHSIMHRFFDRKLELLYDRIKAVILTRKKLVVCETRIFMNLEVYNHKNGINIGALISSGTLFRSN